MRAVIFDEVGGPDVLHVTQVARPVPQYGEVLVGVRACGVNRIDYYLRIEEDDAMPMPHILGSDVAGQVAEVGPGVTGWDVGAAVVVSPSISCGECDWCRRGYDSLCRTFGILGYQTQGGYAEYVAVPARNLLPKPERLSYEEAASLPLALVTAFHALFTQARLEAGDRVLVMGGSSGVGSLAIQLARCAGAWVIATAGDAAKERLSEELGANVVVNHNDKEWRARVLAATGSEGVDVIFEHFGGESLERSLEVAAPGARIVSFGATTGSQIQLDASELFHKQATLVGSYMGSKAELERAMSLVEWDRVRPVIDKVFPLDQACDAHRYMEDRRNQGKIVLKVA